ncbi:MAG: hypothetical protein QF570_02550 [Myxococcota bacterium]|jgi:hypothetical protein|nr:hypothetical protein [Myxococcota bacterium]
MDPVFDCVGDPRAMGHAQGLVCKDAIRAALAERGIATRRSRIPTLRALTRGHRLGRGAGRELVRHYTHLAERMAGIARNADVPFESLMDLFSRATTPPDPSDILFAPAVAIASARTGGAAPILLRTLCGGPFSQSHWWLRRSRPEVGFASIEVTLPWLATAVAGINEAGVSLALVPRSESYGSGVLAGAVNARHAPHAVLLVQECLQRFEDVEGCVDWCSKRPRAGNVSLVIVDAQGRLARAEVEGTGCRISDFDEAVAFDGAPEPLSGALAGHLARDASLSGEAATAVADALGEHSVWLEPAARKLSLRSLRGPGGDEKAVEISL